jgi:uncharacterized protein
MNDTYPEQQFLEYIVKALVDHPEDVVIVRSVDNLGVLLTLTVHKDDMGKVIGRGGKLATQAIRPLLSAVGMKHNARVSLKINEPIGGKRSFDAAPETKSVDEVIDGLN